MTRSVIDSSTHVGRSALVEGAIVGRACDFRDHARIHEGVAIGDNVTLGAESVVFPGVRIYPYKEVETGAQIHESLIWESRASSRLFGRDGVSGLVNVDLTPEVAIRLAAALGTALDRGARVVASRDPAPACRMVKRAIITGLISTGVNVDDLRAAPSPVARHMLKMHAYDAGIHVGTSSSDPEVVQVRIFEPPGIQLSPALQREIEKHFTRAGAAALRVRRGGGHRLPRARPRELRAGPARGARRAGDPRARLPRRRRLRLLRRLVRAPARARPARRRGGLGPRLRLDRRPGAGGLGARSSSSRRGGSCPRSAPTSASSSTAPPSASTSSTRPARR